MTATLTPGAILQAFHYNSSQNSPDDLPPALQVQVIHVKHMLAQQAGASDRYKLILSDGTNYMTGICVAQCPVIYTS